MARFKLVFSKKGFARKNAIEFDAEDAALALVYAHKWSPRHSFELWKDGEKLCRINRTPVRDASLWAIMANQA